MKYQVNDRVDGPKVYDTEAEAQAALPAAQAKFLDREGYRFSVAFVEVDGSNTVWRNATDADPEDGDYRVFVHTTGQYESYDKKTLAHARMQELKDQFLVDAQLDKVYEHVITLAPDATMPTSIL